MAELEWNSHGTPVTRVTLDRDQLTLHTASHADACGVYAMLPGGWSVFRDQVYMTLGHHTHEDELERVRTFLSITPDDL